MNTEVCNAVSGYVRTLYRMNQQCIMLCGVDLFNSTSESYIVQSLDLIRDIPRVIPYSFDKGKKGLVIDKRNGLIEYTDELPFLFTDYGKILDSNYVFLDSIRKIRNKYEHKMHVAQWRYSSNGSNRLLEISFEVPYDGKKETVEISLSQCIQFLKDMNVLFDKIVNEIRNYAEQTNKTEYPYYMKLCQHDFNDFNKLYDSGMITTIGRAFNPF